MQRTWDALNSFFVGTPKICIKFSNPQTGSIMFQQIFSQFGKYRKIKSCFGVYFKSLGPP